MLLEEGLWHLQSRVASLEEEAEEYNQITAPQAVLKWLASHKCVTAPVLAYESGHSPAACRKAINVLYHHGQLVQAHPGGTDGMYIKNPAAKYFKHG